MAGDHRIAQHRHGTLPSQQKVLQGSAHLESLYILQVYVS